MALPQGPNKRCSVDFVADALDWGRRSGCCPWSTICARGAGSFGRYLDRRHPCRAPARCIAITYLCGHGEINTIVEGYQHLAGHPREEPAQPWQSALVGRSRGISSEEHKSELQSLM